MTVNEAINILELHNPFLGPDENLTEAFDMAIKALTAQQWIPCSDCERRCDKWEHSKTSQE